MKKLLGIIVLFLFIFASFVFIKSGYWKNVEISRASKGPWKVYFKNHVGPYHQILADIKAVEAALLEKNVTCLHTYGEFFDDPNKVEHERLKSQVGCLFYQEEVTLIDNDENIKYLESKEILYKVIPQRDYIIGHFEGSPALGPLKVYPKVFSHLETNQLQLSGPIIEVWSQEPNTGFSSLYLFPVSN